MAPSIIVPSSKVVESLTIAVGLMLPREADPSDMEKVKSSTSSAPVPPLVLYTVSLRRTFTFPLLPVI